MREPDNRVRQTMGTDEMQEIGSEDHQNEARWVPTSPSPTPNSHRRPTRATGQWTDTPRPPRHTTAATRSTAGTHHIPLPTTNHQPLPPSPNSNTKRTKATGCRTNHPKSPRCTTTTAMGPTAEIYHPAGYTPTHSPWTHNPRTRSTTTDTMR
jgi:hypothetical protein